MSANAPPKIMVVEDESVIATALERSLTQLGYTVLEPATSCEEAMLIASRTCPDLVLMDVRIRGERDGIETATLLRSTFHVPVVYMTAYADDVTLERALGTEPLGYLLKPFKSRDLRSTVETALFKHEMETRLRQRERWLRTLVRSMADGVVATDADGKVAFINPAAEALLQRSEVDVSGQDVQEVMRPSPEHGQLTTHPLKLALKDDASPNQRTDLRFLSGDGSECLVNTNTAPIVDDERVLGAVMVFRDVSRERRFQQQIEAANRLVSLGTMAAGVGHEINNPLAAISGNLGFLLERLEVAASPEGKSSQTLTAIETTAREVLDVLRDSRDAAQRIREIVRGLSSVARPSEESSRVAAVAKAVEWALHTTLVEMRHRAKVVQRIEDVAPAAISETKLGQVLINLLLNAAHAIEPGDAEHNEVRVVVQQPSPEWVTVEVSDTGHGIPASLRSRIFEPFFTTKAIGRGTGLGLSVCHGIVKSAGGRIEVESSEGEGTRFRLHLKVSVESSPHVKTASLAPDSGPSKVLVVDDDPLVMRALRRMLSGDHTFVPARGVEKAIALLEEGERYDVILCDLMMPDKTGVDLYRYVAARDRALSKRVIFITGGAPTPELRAFLDDFRGRVLEKPFDAVELHSAIARIVASS